MYFISIIFNVSAVFETTVQKVDPHNLYLLALIRNFGRYGLNEYDDSFFQVFQPLFRRTIYKVNSVQNQTNQS